MKPHERINGRAAGAANNPVQLTRSQHGIMRVNLPYATILLSMLLSCGCFPYQFTTRPGASGTVIDAATEAGIPKAIVTLKTDSVRDNEEKVERDVTDADGFFMIEAGQEWSFYRLAMMPEQLKPARLTIEAAGYEPYANDFLGTTMGPGIRRFKCIPLRRLP